jgi:gp16 family phage-associated protein
MIAMIRLESSSLSKRRLFMSTKSVTKKRKPVTPALAPAGKTLSAAEVKTRLQENGLTLKDWAERNGYAYDTVSCVVRGVHRASYGVGHRIAVQLGMKDGVA